jgi:hypothetical protein
MGGLIMPFDKSQEPLEEALMALDWASIAARELSTLLETTAAGDPAAMLQRLKRAGQLIAECQRNIAEAMPTAEAEYNRSP